jgi:ACT domain-containing protein
MIKFIEVKKSLGENRFNIHHINVFHIVDMYPWNGVTQIKLSTDNIIEVSDTVHEILEKINNI